MIYKILSLILALNAEIALSQRVIHADTIESNTGVGSMCVDPTVVLSCSEMSYLDGVTSNLQTQLDGKQSAGSYITALTGDVSATGPGSVAATVNSVGGSSASAVNTGVIAANNATASASSNTIVKRDGSANSAFGQVTASEFLGNLNNSSTINGKAVADYYNDALDVENATPILYSNTIVKRDGFGNAAIGVVTGDVTGTASNVTGVVAIANGGSGQSNAQAGINNLSNSSMTAAEGDVFQWLGGNAQFAAYSAPGVTGSPNTPAYYDAAGDLASTPWWSVDADYSAYRYQYTGAPLTAGAQGLVTAIQADVSGGDKYLHNLYSNGVLVGNYYGLNLNSDDDVTGNSTLMNTTSSNAVSGNFVFWAGYNNNTGLIGGDFRAAQLGNDGTVAGNSAGIINNQGGDVAGSHTGVGSYLNASVGTFGNGNNVIHFDASSYGTHTVHGNVFGLNFNNNHDVPDTNSSIQGVNINNGTAGVGYRFAGVSINQQADMDEEFKGVGINQQGDTRTATGIDVSMSGNSTDDSQGVRVNVSNQTSSSTTNHVHSLDLQGGVVSIQSNFLPFDNGTIDIGNNFTTTTEVNTAITSVDVIQTIIQNNLLLHDTIGAGGFGLGINGLGIVNQIAFDSGVTLPLYRNVLMGTTVPQGSGGTLDTWVNLEMIGLSSFGGSITNNYRIGIQDAQLVGQNWCDNVSIDCWFIRVRDERAENLLGRLAINTVNQKVSTNVGLEIHDKHLKITGTQPTPTVDANAGTGAVCSVSGTDSDGIIDLEMGSSGWSAGSQCSIAFAHAYNSNPVCTFSPTNAAAATAPTTVQPWSATATNELVMFFVNADTASTEYLWSYHCVEAF